MDSGKYIDFHEDEEPNTIWNFIPTDKGFSFKKYTLDHARLGDSDSIYCSLPREVTSGLDADGVVNVSDGIAEYINDSYPDLLKHAFNCPDDRTAEIQSNREIVADAALVVSKKRYAAHVIDDEGNKVDKLKIMGLEIKKSDTPEYVKEMLMRMIKDIIAGKSMEHLHDMVDSMKEEYKTKPLRDIARPMSVKGLKKYNDEYEMTGNTKGFPYNVNAAMFYNSLCSTYDKKIMPGDKVGIIYIKNKGSKYIAFPIDINQFPAFMDDIVVDYDTQWDKAYTKIASYLKTMGWDIESRKKEVKKQLFGF